MVWFLLLTFLTLDYPDHWSSIDRPVDMFITREECVNKASKMNTGVEVNKNGNKYVIARCEFRHPYEIR